MSGFEKRPARWLPKGPVAENDAEPDVEFSQLNLELPEQPWMPEGLETSPFPQPSPFPPVSKPVEKIFDPFPYADQHAPGAKLDAGKPRPGLVLGAFARALEAVARVGTFGASKYSDSGWLHVPNGHERYTDAMLRHYVAEAKGELNDSDSGLSHAAHLAWNALARLELMLREVDRDSIADRQLRKMKELFEKRS